MPEILNLTLEELQTIIEQSISKCLKKAALKSSVRGRRKYITIREFAEHFSMHKQHVSNLIKEGKIEAIKLFGTTTWRIKADQLEIYEKKSFKKTKEDVFTRNF